MLPATHAHPHVSGSGTGTGTGTGPPARRSILGSSRAQPKASTSSTAANGNENASRSGGGSGGGGGGGKKGQGQWLWEAGDVPGPVSGNGMGRSNGNGNGNGHGRETMPTVPQKRKSSAPGGGVGGSSKTRRLEGDEQVRHRHRSRELPSVPAFSSSSSAMPSPALNANSNTLVDVEAGDPNVEPIRCRCGSSVDAGLSIACDECGRWCHAACFGVDATSVPEEWRCWVCQGGRDNSNNIFPPNGHGSAHTSTTTKRRRPSVSSRKPHSHAIDASPSLSVNGGKPHSTAYTANAKTNGGTSANHTNAKATGGSNTNNNNNNANANALNEWYEDERTQYVVMEEDVVPHEATQERLRAYARHWRGVGALDGPREFYADGYAYGENGEDRGHTPVVFGKGERVEEHPTLLVQASGSSSYMASSSSSSAAFPHASITTSQSQSHSILPPSFALHTALPAAPSTLLAKYPATITPSSHYLAQAANGYAHLGAPKRFVHIVGRPLGVAVDARGGGGRGRWVRRGCWPNAEVRAYVCGGGGGGADVNRDRGEKGERRKDGGEKTEREGRKDKERKREKERGEEDEEPKTHFGIFATRALDQGEEIVVGWEWDDANAVHRVGEVAPPLPQGDRPPPPPLPPTPAQRHLIKQLANILHALGGEGECACSAMSHLPPPPPHPPSSRMEQEVEAEAEEEEPEERECVVRTIERIVFPPAPAPPVQVRSARPRYLSAGEEMDVDVDGEGDEGSPRVLVASSSFSMPASSSGYSLGSTSHAQMPSSSSSAFPIASSSSYASTSRAAHKSSSATTPAASSSYTSFATPVTHALKPKPPSKPKRLAGPGVPPPSPDPAASRRWGPLVGAARGVRAREVVGGSGGWGGVVVDEYEYEGDGGLGGYGYRGEYGYADGSRGNRKGKEREKGYEVIEGEGGWIVVPEKARVSGEEEEDVGETGGEEEEERVSQPQPRASVCPPKMRKAWKGKVGVGTAVPPRLDKGKGKERVVERVGETTDAGGDAMDVDGGAARLAIDTTRIPSASSSSSVPLPPATSRQPRHASPTPPVAAASLDGPSPSTHFAQLSLMSPFVSTAPRMAITSSSAAHAADKDVLGRDGSGVGKWGRRRSGVEEEVKEKEKTAPAEDQDDSAAAAAPSSPWGDVEMIPPEVSPRMPSGGDGDHLARSPNLPVHDAHVEDHSPLMAVDVEEEPYRSSPESPAPVSEDDEQDQGVLFVTSSTAAGGESVAPEPDVPMPPPPPVEIPPTDVVPHEVPPSQAVDASAGVADAPAEAPPAREPTPPPPPAPVAKKTMTVKEWRAEQERKRREQEEKEQREREEKEKEQREREHKEREKADAQGEDKENDVVPAKPAEDGLSRVLEGIRRSAVVDKPPLVVPVVHEEAGESEPVACVGPLVAPQVDPPETEKKTAFSLTAFTSTSDELLSPLAVPKAVESRTPSPRPTTVKPPAIPPVVHYPPSSSPVPTLPPVPSKSILQSPQDPRYPSPSFSSNGVLRFPPASSSKPQQTPSPSPSLLSRMQIPSSVIPRPSPPPRHVSPLPRRLPVRAQSQEEGEILPVSTPPRAPPLVRQPSSQQFRSPHGVAPPTQPRSHQAQMTRMPPTEPKALREAQNANTSSSANSSGRGTLRYNGIGPQAVPANVSRHGGGPPYKRHPRR
ncbi:hypothetical protein R3P38DRAFT_3530505 [Favolaschia claudopus]|uniref:PHD-type domain-containing protein n=1 Tax=Favolaschia claudopus TaxID=2862362 RepID=A0AAW0BKT8_9AGAR